MLKLLPYTLFHVWHLNIAIIKWTFRDLNPGLPGYEPGALTNCAKGPKRSTYAVCGDTKILSQKLKGGVFRMNE